MGVESAATAGGLYRSAASLISFRRCRHASCISSSSAWCHFLCRIVCVCEGVDHAGIQLSVPNECYSHTHTDWGTDFMTGMWMYPQGRYLSGSLSHCFTGVRRRFQSRPHFLVWEGVALGNWYTHNWFGDFPSICDLFGCNWICSDISVDMFDLTCSLFSISITWSSIYHPFEVQWKLMKATSETLWLEKVKVKRPGGCRSVNIQVEISQLGTSCEELIKGDIFSRVSLWRSSVSKKRYISDCKLQYGLKWGVVSVIMCVRMLCHLHNMFNLGLCFKNLREKH